MKKTDYFLYQLSLTLLLLMCCNVSVLQASVLPVISAFTPLSTIPVGAAFSGTFSVNDSSGGFITHLRVHVSATSNGSDCAIDVGDYNGTQAGGRKVFAGCAELANQPGLYYLHVEAANSSGVQAVSPSAIVQVGPTPSASTIKQAVNVAAGEKAVCGVDIAGSVRCWGGFAGGDVENTQLISNLEPVSSVGVGNNFACALERTGVVKCWGSNTYGQLGNGTTTGSVTPVPVIGLPLMAQISAGNNFACGLSRASESGKGGAVYCWGLNSYGQLGAVNLAQSNTPVLLSSLQSGVGQISTGAYHSCALLNNGDVRCWGFGGYINSGVSSVISTPVAPNNLSTPVLQIGANNEDSCGLTLDRSIACWGQGTASIQGTLPTSLKGVASGAFRLGHCSLSSGGGAFCQGNNDTGQVGNGHLALVNLGISPNEVTFQKVVGLDRDEVIQLVQGAYQSCAINKVGKMYCWGYQTVQSAPLDHKVYVTTAYEVPSYRSATQTLATPSITSASVQGSDVVLAISDNLPSGSPTVTTLQSKCRANKGYSAFGMVSTVTATGRNPTLRFTLPGVGPWNCAVRSLGTTGEKVWGTDAGAQSPWSTEFAVTNTPTGWPTIQSAKYDSTTATVVFADNAALMEGPVLSKSWSCYSQSIPAGTAGGWVFGTIYVNEPTATTHTLQFSLPVANDWQCRVNYATYGGNSPYGGKLPPGSTSGDPTFMVALEATLPNTPAIISGRVAGTKGLLTFKDSQTTAATNFDAIVSCTRLRDGSTGWGGLQTVSESFGGTHTVMFQLGTSDYLQDPDTYSCTVKVRSNILTSPESALFTIKPNQPPIVSTLTAKVVDGHIDGDFLIADPDGDRIKNMNVHFGTNPKGGDYLCSSGYLAPPEQLLNPGQRSYRADNESCLRMLDQETTIYAWLEVYDEHGRQAEIKPISFTNVPPTPPDPATSKIVFEQVPSSLAVDQSTDITLRMTDGAGNTMTDYHGWAKITKDVSIPWSMQDAANDTDDGERTVWFNNGVATIRALTFHQAGTVTLTATSESSSQAAASAALSKSMRVAAMALSSGQGAAKGNATFMIGQAPPEGVKVILNLFSLTNRDWEELRNGTVKLSLFAGANNELPLYVDNPQAGILANHRVPNGSYMLIARRNGVAISSWNALGYWIKVNGKELSQKIGVQSWQINNKGKKAVMLVHGIFGSTLANSGNGKTGPGAIMPGRSCVEPLPIDVGKPDPCNLVFYNPAYIDQSGWDNLKVELQKAGYYVVDVAYDWRASPGEAARTLEKRIAQAKKSTGLSQVDVFAHSMGGIVAINYLKSKEGQATDIDRLIMVGTPLAGSVNAYYLMAQAHPLMADELIPNNYVPYSKIGIYSSLADQVFADFGNTLFKEFWYPPQRGVDKDYKNKNAFGTEYATLWNKEKRYQFLASNVPSGWSLYPKTDKFADPKVSRLSEYRSQSNRAGVNPVLSNIECLLPTIATSRINPLTTADKTRIFYLEGNSESTITAINQNDAPIFGLGDGTVPFQLGVTTGNSYSQTEEFKRVMGISSNVLTHGVCVFPGSYGTHSEMPGNENVIAKTQTILTLPASAAVNTMAASNPVVAVAVPSPSLMFGVRGTKFFALNGSFGTVGADSQGSVTATAGSAEYFQVDDAASAAVSSPTAGSYTMTLQPSESSARIMTSISASYGNGSTELSYNYSFLLGNSPETLTFDFSDSTPSLRLTGRPAPVPKVLYSASGNVSTVGWVAPEDPSITGYRVYARRAQADEWRLVGTADAAARSVVVSVPPASNDNPEQDIVVIAVNNQGEGPVGDVNINKLDVPPSLDFGESVVVEPLTQAVSAEAVAHNLVAQAFSVEGGEFSINSGVWSTGGGLLNLGDHIQVRGNAPATPGDVQTVTVSTSMDTASFAIAALDMTPDTFGFESLTGVALSTLVESSGVIINGINKSTPISVKDGEYSIDGAPYTSITGTINAGSIVKVRHVSSGQVLSSVITKLTIGGVEISFTSTTGSDGDNDGIVDALDNCPVVANTDQKDFDGDKQGNACDVDDDNDGLSDTWETTYGLNPLDAADANTDTDADGLSNLDEFKYGTNPTQADTDSDGASDKAEVDAGRNPVVNEGAVMQILDGMF